MPLCSYVKYKLWNYPKVKGLFREKNKKNRERQTFRSLNVG